MKRSIAFASIAVILLLAVAAASGYFVGSNQHPGPQPEATAFHNLFKPTPTSEPGTGSSTSLASSGVVSLTMNNIQQVISSLGKQALVIYVCAAERDACALEDQAVAQAAAASNGTVKYLYVNADQAPDLAARMGVTSAADVPYFLIAKDNQSDPIPVSGYFSARELAQIVDAVVSGKIAPATAAPTEAATQPATVPASATPAATTPAIATNGGAAAATSTPATTGEAPSATPSSGVF